MFLYTHWRYYCLNSSQETTNISILILNVEYNNPDFDIWIPLIYLQRSWDKKKPTETASSASFPDIYVKLDTHGQHSNFSFGITTFPHLDSYIPTAHLYGVYISQIICYIRTCSLYLDTLQHHCLPSTKLLNQITCVHMMKSGIGNYILKLIRMKDFTVCCHGHDRRNPFFWQKILSCVFVSIKQFPNFIYFIWW